MNRRQFLQGALSTALAAAVPAIPVVINLTATADEATLKKAIKIVGFSKNVADVRVDSTQMWKAVRLHDQWNREWHIEGELEALISPEGTRHEL